MRASLTALFLSLGTLLTTGNATTTTTTGLIENLAADSFQTRQKASAELWEKGSAALPDLRRAALSDDPEISLRSTELIEKIELRITPETDPEVLEIIRQYRQASLPQKSNLISQLRQKKAIFQAFKLVAQETAPDLKANLSTVLRGAAIFGAREALASGDTQAAIDLLQLSSTEPTSLIALACLYHSTGRLDAELKNPSPPANIPTDTWLIALHRANGDLPKALALAASTPDSKAFSWLSVLAGDPTHWLRQNGLSDRRKQAHPTYIEIALRRWSGKKITEPDFATLLAEINTPDPEQRGYATSALATLGRLHEVETLSAQLNPYNAFLYYLSQEKIPLALTSIGIDPDMPDYTTWVQKRFEEIAAAPQPDEQSSEPSARLITLANFLETRGLSQEIATAFDPPLIKYAAENENQFLDLLGKLFAQNAAPLYATSVATKWAGADAARWTEIFASAFAENEAAPTWIEWARELQPDLKNPQLLEALLAIFRIGHDPQNLREKYLALAWTATDRADKTQKPTLLVRILALAIDQQDVKNALRAWDTLIPANRSDWPRIDQYFSAAGRWKDAVTILTNNGDTQTTPSPEAHAYLAATLRRAGMEKLATKHDKLAEKLALGHPLTCRRIGDSYSYGGDPARAAIWYQRSAFCADTSSNDYIPALGTYAESAFEQKQWEISASCYEAFAQIHASRDGVGNPIPFYSRARLNADLAKALAILPKDRENALRLLSSIHQNFSTDGVLADHFFPLIRAAGLTRELESWFAESWEKISAVIRRYPDSDNCRNTAAWFAARAAIQLPAAEDHIKAALARNPNQPAYLDTMAEIQFAKGNQESAQKWSDKALLQYPLTEPSPSFDLILRKQNYRFHQP